MKSLFVLAGEQSGDHIGGAIIRALKQQGDYTFFGVGGSDMKKEGVELLYSIEELSVMGIGDVAAALPRIYRRFHEAKNWIIKNNPQGVLLIDYAEFNLLMAKHLRKKGYLGKIIQFVCPSIWAWRRKRKRSLIEHYDLLLTLLPFEAKLFENTSLKTVYCGHPLAKEYLHIEPKKDLSSPLKVAIFPGSRTGEIVRNLPIQLSALKEFQECQILISIARPELVKIIQKIVDKAGVANYLLVNSEDKKEMMQAVDCALATSGTINLELALSCTPSVVTYKVPRFSYFLVTRIFKIFLPYFSLPNIICNQAIFPEFLSDKLSPIEIGRTLGHVLEKREFVHKRCKDLKALLNQSDPATKARDEIHYLLEAPLEVSLP